MYVSVSVSVPVSVSVAVSVSVSVAVSASVSVCVCVCCGTTRDGDLTQVVCVFCVLCVCVCVFCVCANNDHFFTMRSMPLVILIDLVPIRLLECCHASQQSVRGPQDIMQIQLVYVVY